VCDVVIEMSLQKIRLKGLSNRHNTIPRLTGFVWFNKGDTRVPADNGDISLKDEDVRDNETYIKDNDSKFGGN
jgi:hypothetical protein